MIRMDDSEGERGVTWGDGLGTERCFYLGRGRGDGRNEVVASDRPVPSSVFQRPTGVPAPC